jgi:hypothetical protein
MSYLLSNKRDFKKKEDSIAFVLKEVMEFPEACKLFTTFRRQAANYLYSPHISRKFQELKCI